MVSALRLKSVLKDMALQRSFSSWERLFIF